MEAKKDEVEIMAEEYAENTMSNWMQKNNIQLRQWLIDAYRAGFFDGTMKLVKDFEKREL